MQDGSGLGMDIREIESIIDVEHKNHPLFQAGKEQTVYDLLTSFEDICGLILIGGTLNPTALRKITDQMDALNTALLWTNQLCSANPEPIKTDLTELRYAQCCDLLNNYAYPYSVICSGYISYSRHRFSAEIDGNVIIFNPCKDQNESMWSDIIRANSEVNLTDLESGFESYKFLDALNELRRQVTIDNGYICYSLSERIISAFKEIALQQWNATKTLPENWTFDTFGLNEYKDFWVTLAALCYIHFCSWLTISNPSIRLRNCTIIQSEDELINYIEANSGLTSKKVQTIIRYITYDATKRNVDIMYQPIVKLTEGILIIAPLLFMGSRPERNLLSVVSTKHDDAYSREVNELEEQMVTELESYVSSPYTAKHKHLRADLPDIDFAVFDSATNSSLICEMKWFAAADSTKEVLAKEDEITHGCEQAESILTYAMSDRKRFIKQVFNVDITDAVDLFCCVVAKHNIRTQHKYVPVIDLKRMEELLENYSLNTVFHMVRNHEYEMPFPKGATIAHQTIRYAGFEFRVPAICFDSLQI